MDKFVEDKEANRQVNKIKELVSDGYSDEEIVRKFELDGEENLAVTGRICTVNEIEQIRLSFHLSQRK
jgi:hypothetical protein